jgi:DNA-binding beta-propeller fold protein YncE
MNIGPNGNLYICQYQLGAVTEIDFAGNFVSQWFQPPNSRSQDIEFLPGGGFVVPVMGNNVAYRYNAAHIINGVYVGTGWQRPHGVDLNPADGLLYIVDGVTMQVHVFNPITMVELNPAWLVPDPGDKIVDIEFRQDEQIVPVVPSGMTSSTFFFLSVLK